MNREQKAKEFANWAHRNQERKYTGLPYITHPAQVVEIVRSVPHSENMICAAWLHDVVEDCGVTLDQIEEVFGYAVRELVDDLTDVSKPSDGKREHRKSIDRLHLAKASPSAKTIKLADLIDNSRDILQNDPKFARVYLKEKALLLAVLRDGDETLWNQAHEFLKGHGYKVYEPSLED